MGRRSRARSEQRISAKSSKAGVLFACNLRRVCRSRELSVAELSKRIGRSQKTVERMLAGHANPGLAVISAIARKLNVPLAELVRGI